MYIFFTVATHSPVSAMPSTLSTYSSNQTVVVAPGNESPALETVIDCYNFHTYTQTCKCRTRCTASRSCLCRKANMQCSIMCHPGYICHNRQSAKTSEAVNVFDTTNSATPKTAQIWCQIGIYRLTFQHQRTPGMWLDDEIVAATQHF